MGWNFEADLGGVNDGSVDSMKFLAVVGFGGYSGVRDLTITPSTLVAKTADSFGGSFFGYQPYDGGWYFGPADYTASTSISGWARFGNTTLSAMGAIFASPLTVLKITATNEPLVTYSTTVPEPSTWALLGLGFSGLLFFRKRHALR